MRSNYVAQNDEPGVALEAVFDHLAQIVLVRMNSGPFAEFINHRFQCH